MTALKTTAQRIVSQRPWPVSQGGMTQLEIISRRLAQRSHEIGTVRRRQSWNEFLPQINLQAVETIRSRDFRRLLAEMWEHQTDIPTLGRLVAHVVRCERKSYDRSLIIAYLRHFPIHHPAFRDLELASGTVANRHDWPWQERGRRWNLWQPHLGPAELGAALLASDKPDNILHEAGLDGDLAEGGFTQTALQTVLQGALKQQGGQAELTGDRIMKLFSQIGSGKLHGPLSYTLLVPWIGEAPTEIYRRQLSDFITGRIADPRFDKARWSALGQQAREWMPGSDVEAAFSVLWRWMVQTTVREFFKVVGRATRDPVQWRAREAFWLSYLEAGLITDAWFAFGRVAEQTAGKVSPDGTIRYGRISAGADPTHSALIMSLGDARVAEWSHNGACRFWRFSDAGAPQLYLNSYDGSRLKAMAGGTGFDYMAHHGGWQKDFSAKLKNLAQIPLPQNVAIPAKR